MYVCMYVCMYVQTFQPVPPKRDSRQENGENKNLFLFKTTPEKYRFPSFRIRGTVRPKRGAPISIEEPPKIAPFLGYIYIYIYINIYIYMYIKFTAPWMTCMARTSTWSVSKHWNWVVTNNSLKHHLYSSASNVTGNACASNFTLKVLVSYEEKQSLTLGREFKVRLLISSTFPWWKKTITQFAYITKCFMPSRVRKKLRSILLRVITDTSTCFR